jgi:hypothetical protein
MVLPFWDRIRAAVARSEQTVGEGFCPSSGVVPFRDSKYESE